MPRSWRIVSPDCQSSSIAQIALVKPPLNAAKAHSISREAPSSVPSRVVHSALPYASPHNAAWIQTMSPPKPRRIDIIYNMTAVCPHDCASCCVDAVHVTRRGSFVVLRQEGLEFEERIALKDRSTSIYDAAAAHLQGKGLELTFQQKLNAIDNIDVTEARLDISGGDALAASENMGVLRHASARLSRHNITLTATGVGLGRVDIGEVSELIGEFNFTFDSASHADIAHRPRQYASPNLKAARQFSANGCAIRAEFPISRSTSSPDHLRRLYMSLHEASVNKLLLMRLFPVGRGEHLAHDILEASEYQTAISYLRQLESTYGHPALSLQCALRHLEVQGKPQAGRNNPCDLVTESFGLTPNGQLLSSPWAINRKGQPLDEFFVLGNLAQTPLSEILATRRVLDIRSRANDNFGHCKIFAYLNSTKSTPIDRLLDAADPLYS